MTVMCYLVVMGFRLKRGGLLLFPPFALPNLMQSEESLEVATILHKATSVHFGEGAFSSPPIKMHSASPV